MKNTITQNRQHPVGERGHYFSTFELILLALCASLVIVSRVLLHLPLHLPGHSGVFWMAALVITRGLVPKVGAISLVGLSSGIIATFMGMGDKGPVSTLLSYLSAGVAVDLVALFLGGVDNILAAALAGVAGNVAKLLTKALVYLVLEIPAGFVTMGLLFFSMTTVVAGAAGGVLGWCILRALRKAGFFLYLAEKR